MRCGAGEAGWAAAGQPLTARPSAAQIYSPDHSSSNFSPSPSTPVGSPQGLPGEWGVGSLSLGLAGWGLEGARPCSGQSRRAPWRWPVKVSSSRSTRPSSQVRPGQAPGVRPQGGTWWLTLQERGGDGGSVSRSQAAPGSTVPAAVCCPSGGRVDASCVPVPHWQVGQTPCPCSVVLGISWAQRK